MELNPNTFRMKHQHVIIHSATEFKQLWSFSKRYNVWKTYSKNLSDNQLYQDNQYRIHVCHQRLIKLYQQTIRSNCYKNNNSNLIVGLMGKLKQDHYGKHGSITWPLCLVTGLLNTHDFTQSRLELRTFGIVCGHLTSRPLNRNPTVLLSNFN